MFNNKRIKKLEEELKEFKDKTLELYHRMKHPSKFKEGDFVLIEDNDKYVKAKVVYVGYTKCPNFSSWGSSPYWYDLVHPDNPLWKICKVSESTLYDKNKK